MLDVSKYIKDLLFVHDCVILPGFGGFIANYKAAKIAENQNLISPPSKAIGFNRNLTQNDGLLINHLAEAENLKYAEAEKSIQFFVEDIRVRIQRGEKVELSKVGCFYNDKRYNLQFEPSMELNYLSDSFGLEQIELPVLSHEEFVTTLPKSNTVHLFSKKRLWYAAAAIPFVLTIALLPMNSERSQFRTSASMGLTNSENVTAKNHVQLKAQISPPEEYVHFEPTVFAAPPEQKAIQKQKFYLIAGSFTSIQNAEILQKELRGKSYPAIIIENKNLFSVAINQFDNRTDAYQYKKNVISKNPKASCWVLAK